MNTRRYPRTMVEAFGPDADSANPIECPPQSNIEDRIIFWAGVVCVASVLGLIAAGWL